MTKCTLGGAWCVCVCYVKYGSVYSVFHPVANWEAGGALSGKLSNFILRLEEKADISNLSGSNRISLGRHVRRTVIEGIIDEYPIISIL